MYWQLFERNVANFNSVGIDETEEKELQSIAFLQINPNLRFEKRKLFEFVRDFQWNWRVF